MQIKKEKVTFIGGTGSELAGLLEKPTGRIWAYALFAHCFTCGKDVVAGSRIARALVDNGIAVLRFDFTGLGNSDGDFANTNFSSNVGDLVAAADFLRTQYEAPKLLIGHSLGGTAVLHAAASIKESLGVATIGSPAEAEHVKKQFSIKVDEIQSAGAACVELAGRQFTIKKQFLDDISQQSQSVISHLGKSLLIFHSPIDNIVSIDQAEKIYRQAKHPKNFISLHKADHLLRRKSDAQYVANSISTWASHLLDNPDVTEQTNLTKPAKGEVIVSEDNQVFTQKVMSDDHQWLSDEPTSLGGNNLGPDPYEHLLAALGSCTSMTMRMYARRKKWSVGNIQVTVSHRREHGEDCLACDEEHPQVDVIERKIKIDGAITEEQHEKLMSIADRCPVHRTLHGKLDIQTKSEK